MIKILFVCHGNICRSPLAECLFNHHVMELSLQDKMYSNSAATSTEEIGNPIYPPIKELLTKHNLTSTHRACQVTKSMLDDADYVIVMDDNNLYNLYSMFPNLAKNKVYKMLNFINSDNDVDDPWYTRQFKQCFDQIDNACKALIEHISTHNLNTKA